MTAVEIVRFDPDLLGQAAALRSEMFGGTPESNYAYFEWKYLRNPYIREPIMHLALAGGRVIGMRASMGTCWEVGGRRYVLPQGGDAMVHASYHRQGIFRRMLHEGFSELRERGFSHSIALSTTLLVADIAQTAGSRTVTTLETVRRDRRARRLAGTGPLKRAARLVARVGASVSSRAPYPRPTPFAALDAHRLTGVTVTPTPRPDRLADLAARSPSDKRLRHVRDESYFAWRLANPLSDYRALVADDAYLILQWHRHGDLISLVDWRAAAPAVVAPLVRAAAAHVRLLRVWSSTLDPQVASVVEELGFERLPPDTDRPFLVTELGTGEGQSLPGAVVATSPQSWHLQMLDAEAF